MHHPADRIIRTSVFVTPVVEHWLELEIAQWVHPIKDRSDDPSHHEDSIAPNGNGMHYSVLLCSRLVLSAGWHCVMQNIKLYCNLRIDFSTK